MTTKMLNRVIVFDLDDTLYKEEDYLRSAYSEIAARYGVDAEQMFRDWQQGRDVFKQIVEERNQEVSISELLHQYRVHKPNISLDNDTKELLEHLSKENVLGIITDGRSETQRNKVCALGLEQIISWGNILISEETGFEKPNEQPYLHFMVEYPNYSYYYVGDNTSKDFIAPNQLGWTSICLLDNGRNIHRQSFCTSKQGQPQVQISTLSQLLSLL